MCLLICVIEGIGSSADIASYLKNHTFSQKAGFMVSKPDSCSFCQVWSREEVMRERSLELQRRRELLAAKRANALKALERAAERREAVAAALEIAQQQAASHSAALSVATAALPQSGSTDQDTKSAAVIATSLEGAVDKKRRYSRLFLCLHAKDVQLLSACNTLLLVEDLSLARSTAFGLEWLIGFQNYKFSSFIVRNAFPRG